MARETPGAGGSPEHWKLDHPRWGLLEVLVGTREQLGVIDPGFPGAGATPASTRPEATELERGRGDASEPEVARADASPADRPAEQADTPPGASSPSRSLWDKIVRLADDPMAVAASKLPGSQERCVLVRSRGEVVGRWEGLGDLSVPVGSSQKPLRPGEYTPLEVGYGRPRLEIDAAFTRTWVREVTFRGASEVVLLDPPAGSRAERHHQKLERHPLLRWALPLLSGMGKAGWALGVLVLAPLLGKILEWLFSLLPDVDIPWPNIPWPDIPWPEISLPQIDWPDIPWPDIPWPEFTPPEWMLWLAEYRKVWLPILIGLIIGISALRDYRRSQQAKQRLEEEKLRAMRGRFAADARQLQRRLAGVSRLAVDSRRGRT